jgi:prevent-host-death family protein
MTSMPAWTVAEAKAKFSQVIEQARTGPQTITRNGRPAAVVVSAEEWERRTSRTGTLADFLAASPLRGSGLKTERGKDQPRDIDL